MGAKKRTLFQNGRVILIDRILSEGDVVVEGNSIVDVHRGSLNKPDSDEVIDLQGDFLAPGFIDMHIHGSNGIDVMTASQDDLARLSCYLLSQGVTRYLPTTVPTDEGGFLSLIEFVAHYLREQPPDGAQVMGLHFEGPFVSPKRPGALPVEYFRTFTSHNDAAIFLDDALGQRLPIRMMTLAPEIAGGLALVEALKARDYTVAIGHSQASFEMCDQAAAMGARHVTHFPNALTPLHHRQPGVCGWALFRPHVTLDMIVDGIHLDWRMIELVRRLKPSDHIALISDAIAPAGLGDGEYHLWGEKIRVRNGRAQNANGAITGSVMSLRNAVGQLHQHGVSLVDGVKSASLVPARLLRIDDRLGTIEKGKCADFVCFDETGDIHFTCVNGEVVHRATETDG